MDRMIYLAMSAAKQNLQAQALSTHNLANASTVGFKADFEAMRSMPVYGPGLPSRAYAMTERPGTDFAAGSLVNTGRELDIAVTGPGFIAVIGPDGTEAYTRAGDLQLTANGQLLTGAGHPVLGNGGPIAVPQSQSVLIGVDGTITVRAVGQEPNAPAQVDRIRLVRPDPAELDKGTDGLFRRKDGLQAPPDANVRITRGALEQSNVNSVLEMVSLITNARNYEMAVKAMNTAQQVDAAGARLLSLNG